ncbi:CLAVATA3/ESR (CLE)-related protein 1 [Camellia lanceoleosa]|uniref:CLAVATA3/ESR (CLE)-related protein 1 n=1 Tax=Camellia lanceoleosa TaxID=1840588 RepID=A0ACC0GEB9_9ERIC|nr:CLAVATA3/ESR (CLE)-related protein 1 [Camellia lanceoleosa]
MAKWNFWLCFALILCSVTRSDSRTLNPLVKKRGELSVRYQAVLEEAQEMYHFRLRNDGLSELWDESKQVSPGGPDPKHH